MANNKKTKAKKKGVRKKNDVTLEWIQEKYPQLADWRELCVSWLEGETRGVSVRLEALTAFFERYLVALGLPLAPAVFLARETTLPDFYKTACPPSAKGVQYNNLIHAFLEFVLLHHFSERDDYHRPTVSPTFHNPVPRRSIGGLPKRDDAKPKPLPYAYIDELRQMLAQGTHFRNWAWAQTALGVEIGKSGGNVAPDWFEVTEDQIDRNDPDCVWRERPTTRRGTVLEMWSPVRWVALLVKLIIPLRTFQVRMLDSGEADTWRYEGGEWVLNPNRLTQGSATRPLHQGVFRRAYSLVAGEDASTVLYINTNKTADIAKSGPEKGYELPWYDGGQLHQNAFYWLEKLRNWQAKYNPITRRTAWGELDGRHIVAKSDVQL